MKDHSQKPASVHSVYSQAIYLALFAHVIIAATFGILRIYPLFFYNLFSIFFYLVAKLTLSPRHYRLTVSAVHAEIVFFAALTTVYVGWAPGYAFYLIALCSLVYICPYKNIYVPYFFSVGELFVFLGLKLYTNTHAPVAAIASGTALNYIYLFNATACFGVIIYAALISNISSIFTKKELMEQNQNLQALLHHDDLTQLYTRNYLLEKFNRAKESSHSTALIMIDVDNFKHVNDTYGHSCGDYVLFTISTIMQTVCPPQTDIGRWGGEEFVLLIHNMQKKEVLEQVQNLRKAVEAYHFHYSGTEFRITATFGVSFTEETGDFTSLVNLADERMYRGKQSGKNTVVADA